MEALVYIFLSNIVWVLVLFAAKQVRHRLAEYTGFSLLFSLAGLVLFYLFSWLAGIISFGTPTSRNIPDDYVTRGIPGLAILLVAAAGIVSPATAAWIVRKKRGFSLPLAGS